MENGMLLDKFSPPTLRLSIEVDYIKSKHLSAVLKIDRESYADPWSQDQFYGFVKNGGFCIIAKNNGTPVGYAVYENSRKSIYLERMAVSVGVRRHGVASSLVREIKRRADEGKRLRIVALVPDDNLGAQLFFSAMGFKAEEVVRDFCRDPPGDAYRMVCRLRTD